MQSKMTETMILTRSASEHDGEQVDSHGYGIEDRQGPQSIRHRVFLQEQNTAVRNPLYHYMNKTAPFCCQVTVAGIKKGHRGNLNLAI